MVTEILILVGAQSLEKRQENLEIRRKMVSIQIIALRSTTMLRSVQETREDLLSLKLHWNTTNYSWNEQLTKSEMIKRVEKTTNK